MVVTVVDMAVSNVGSVANMLRRVGASVDITAVPEKLAAAERLVMPGVGAFDGAMRHLAAVGAVPALAQAVVDRGIPTLGICLGMQILADGSEEGVEAGLGFVPGQVRRLTVDRLEPPQPVPHMGWNTVQCSGSGHPVAALAAEPDRRYYFVHSYALECRDADDAAGTTRYGAEEFTSMVARDSIVGAQFHPEKSHRHGMALLTEWLGI